MRVVAVPVKDLTNAKRRLVRVLSPGERMELARAMLRDVLTALRAARVDALWVVTRDTDVAAIAAPFGAEVLRETDNRGHTAAVALAQRHAVATGTDTFLTVPGDVPCVTAGEIGALLAAAASGVAAFVPSRSRLGTNGVALHPPDAMALTFGEPSFDNHLAEARRRGLVPRVLSLPGLALDIDAPEDLRTLAADGAATESGRLCAAWSVADRVASAAAAGRDHR